MTDVYEFIATETKTPTLIVLSEVRCVAMIAPDDYSEKGDEWDAWKKKMKGQILVKVCYKGLFSGGKGAASCSSWFPEKEARRVYDDLKLLISKRTEDA